MKVVLLTDVKSQGKKNDVIEVSDGYARNYLIPRKLAVEADSSVLNAIKGKEEALRHKIETETAEAKATGWSPCWSRSMPAAAPTGVSTAPSPPRRLPSGWKRTTASAWTSARSS